MSLRRRTRGRKTKEACGGGGMKTIQKNIPKFIRKLNDMLKDSRNHQSIRWSQSGEIVQILNAKSLLDDVIPQYFNQECFRSFTRQLNSYGFKKLNSLHFSSYLPNTKSCLMPNHDLTINQNTNSGVKMMEFIHPLFKRDQISLYSQISRKSSSCHISGKRNLQEYSEPTLEEYLLQPDTKRKKEEIIITSSSCCARLDEPQNNPPSIHTIIPSSSSSSSMNREMIDLSMMKKFEEEDQTPKNENVSSLPNLTNHLCAHPMEMNNSNQLLQMPKIVSPNFEGLNQHLVQWNNFPSNVSQTYLADVKFSFEETSCTTRVTSIYAARMTEAWKKSI